MIDEKVASRLDENRIIWMTTVRPDGQPQSAPVWYVWNGDEVRIWSLDGIRVANLAKNRKVNLHLNSDERGNDIVIIEGEAVVDSSIGPASADRRYVERYQSFIDEYGWTWGWFDNKYSVPVRISPTKVRD